MNAISAVELTRRFGQFVAVDRVSFDVQAGEIFGFLGSNGAGKSTTIRMLCGLLKPTSGTATVGGIDVGRDPEGVKRRIGYMSQRFSLYEQLTVDENIRFFGGLYGLEGKRLEDRRAFVLEMAGLRGREKMRASELAGGWRQRLALGCSILHEPPILFLDEPTGGVDPLPPRILEPDRPALDLRCHRARHHALPGRGGTLPSNRDHPRDKLARRIDPRAEGPSTTARFSKSARPGRLMRCGCSTRWTKSRRPACSAPPSTRCSSPGTSMPSARSPIDCRRPASGRAIAAVQPSLEDGSSKSRIERHDRQPRVCRRPEGAAPDQRDRRTLGILPSSRVLSAALRIRPELGSAQRPHAVPTTTIRPTAGPRRRLRKSIISSWSRPSERCGAEPPDGHESDSRGLVIPAGFARTSTSASPAVQILLNGDNANTAATVMATPRRSC